jgi:hypothetical protein
MPLPLLVVAALALPTEVAPERELELAVLVTPTTFFASNPTDRLQAVILEGATGLRSTLLIPAHTTFDSRFPEGTLEGLQITVMARTNAGVLVSSGSLPLEPLSEAGHDFIWFDVQTHAHAWIEADDSTFLVLGSSAQPDTSGSHSSCSSAALHVPVVSPEEESVGELPPPLPPAPLPPL